MEIYLEKEEVYPVWFANPEYGAKYDIPQDIWEEYTKTYDTFMEAHEKLETAIINYLKTKIERA